MELTGCFAHLDPLAVLCPASTRGLSGHLDTHQIFQYSATIKLIARNTKAAVIAVTESNLDSSIFDSEINIEN
ncbi:hypothetical protein DPMN_163873 [Dreissena polymorpha]|uniref:Uncharacterized protein n=1 Tax=Dreissena polymorpha TaxID=45954 RepID=A0A9D4IUU5_DREPO|nr:hypothetical protein DPMN_163873 [Dreissena polymorpha]